MILLVRHGESTGNAARVFSGVMDHPLTDHGREQAAAVAARLAGRHFATVFTSRLCRAMETADILLTVGACTIGRRLVAAELNERDFGVLEGMPQPDAMGLPEQDLRRLTMMDPRYRPDRGESLRDTYDRVTAYSRSAIQPAAAEGDILVVAHGNVIKCLINWHLDWPFEILPDIPMHNCLITRLPTAAP